MKSKVLISFLIIIVIAGIAAYYFAQRDIKSKHNSDKSINEPSQQESAADKIEEDTTYESTIYFVPVSKFTNTKTNYTQTELKSKNIITLSTYNKDSLPEDYNYTFVDDITEVNTALSKGEVAFLLPQDVSPKYKTLAVDSYYFWNKNLDLDKYPLAKTVEVSEALGVIDRDKISNIYSTGEIIPARAVDRLGLNKYNDYTYLFDYFKDDLKNANISMAMLENSLLGDPEPCTGCMVFRGDDKVAKGIADVGFDMFTTAGNHAGDAGQDGYPNTIKLFNENKVEYSGTGNASDSYPHIAIKELNGMKVGLIGADDIASYYWLSNWYKKNTEDTNYKNPISGYGTYYFSTTDGGYLHTDEAKTKALAEIKKHYEIDYMIVFLSWGIEYTNYPTEHQKDLGKSLIDNGANLIIASHPHWVQSIDFYKDVPIIYSMGNFIFDQTHTLETRQGMNVSLTYYGNDLKSIELIPHQTCGYHQTNNDLTPKLLSGELTLDQLYDTPESQGCVYWQPKKLKESSPSYKQILERVFQYTDIEL